MLEWTNVKRIWWLHQEYYIIKDSGWQSNWKFVSDKKCKMANVKLGGLSWYISPDEPAFKVGVFTNDYIFWIRVKFSLTPWPFKPLPGLFCFNIFIGCAQKKGWYNKPRIFSLPVSPYFQSLQLPPTWDGRRWVKRFGPGDPHTPAALLSSLQVSPLTPNFQTSYYFLPTRWYRWLLGLFLRFRLSPAVFLCLIGPGT